MSYPISSGQSSRVHNSAAAHQIEPVTAATPADLPRQIALLVEQLQTALVFGQSMARATVSPTEAAELEIELAGLIASARSQAEEIAGFDQHLGLLAHAFVANTGALIAAREDLPPSRGMASSNFAVSDDFLLFGLVRLGTLNELVSAFLAVVDTHFDDAPEGDVLTDAVLSNGALDRSTAEARALRQAFAGHQQAPETATTAKPLSQSITAFVKSARREALSFVKRHEQPVVRLVCETGLVRWVPDPAVKAFVLTREAHRQAKSRQFSSAAKNYQRICSLGDQVSLPQFDIAAGALDLFGLKSAAGAARLVAGFNSPICTVASRLKVSSVPSIHAGWLANNFASFKLERFWRVEFEAAQNDLTAADLFRQRLALIVYLSGEFQTGAVMFSEQRRLSVSSDNTINGALFALWASDWDEARPFHFKADAFPGADADQAVVAALIQSAARQNAIMLSEIQQPKAISPYLSALLQNPMLQPLFDAMQALQRGDYNGAQQAVRPVLDRNSERLVGLSRRPTIRKIFLSGFGWSGSSAVHDALTGYPGGLEMPGTGDIAHINAGADNEPVYLQGDAGLGSLWSELKSQNRLSARALWSFFRLYVLATEPHTYEQYKAAHASRALQKRLGDLYYVLLMDLIANIAKEGALTANAPAELPRFSVKPFQRYSNLLVAALAKDGDRFALFNNALFVHAAGQIELVSDAVMVAVGRDVRDQFADQRRNNLYFSHKPASFVSRNQRQRGSLDSVFGAIKARRSDLSYQYVQFERFVLDTAYRTGVIRSLIGRHNPVFEAVNFDPAASSRNIGAHVELLEDAELATFNASNLAFDASAMSADFTAKRKSARNSTVVGSLWPSPSESSAVFGARLSLAE
jgi:hypothetical protein